MRAFESSLRTVLLLGVGVAAFMGAFRAAPSAPPRPKPQPVTAPVTLADAPGVRAPSGEDPISLLGLCKTEGLLRNCCSEKPANADGSPPFEYAADRLLILPLPADAEADVLEFRRRTRHAIHRALLQQQWQLDGAETLRIGCFLPPGAESPRQYFYETARQPSLDGPPTSAAIVWVRYEDLGASALEGLRTLGARFHAKSPDGERPWLRVIGPAYSDHLIELARQARAHTPPTAAQLELISPWATVDPRRILQDADVEADDEQDPVSALKAHFEAARVIWQPMVRSDQVLIALLKAELEARIRPARSEPRPAEPAEAIRLMLITEAGSSYGRFWGNASHWVGARRAGGRGAPRQSPPWKEPAASFAIVDQFSFARGLDGGQATADAKAPGVEPSGVVQLDYLLRTFEDVEHLHRVYPSAAEPHAIGVFATDVYDKLLLIRLLNEAFPRALLFTSDYDERLLLPSELEHTRGLLIASQYGPGGSAPAASDPGLLSAHWRWRDWVQESTFEAASAALGAQPIPALGWQHLRLYEAGSRGAVPLQFTSSGDELSRPLLADRAEALGFYRFLLGLLLVLVAAMTLKLRQSIYHPAPMPGVRGRRAEWALYGIATVATVLAIAGFGAIARSAVLPFDEPVTLFDGVSVWPAVAARLFAIPLLLFGFFVAWRNARLGRLEVKHFRCAAMTLVVVAAYALLLWWVRSIGGATRAPTRGVAARDWMLVGTVVSVLLIVGLVTYASAMALWGRREMRRFRHEYADGLATRAPGWSQAFGRDLDRIGRMAARLTAVTWIPATAMALTFFSRWNAIDDFTWSFWIVVQILIPLVVLVATLAMIRVESVLIRRKLQAAFLLHECTFHAGKDQPDDVGQASTYLNAYKRGPFGPLSEDPLVLSLLIPLAAFGSGGWIESLGVFSAR